MSNKNSGNSRTQNPEFPTANRTQAQRQLELLGYKPEDKIYLRFFYPSDDPRKGADKGRKASRLNWQEIETYQRQGRGVYFVINGGGHKDEDVTVGRAIFCEHDHLAKDIQRDLWKTLNLPEPTFQVDTGGKSIHSFWVFTQPIPISDWCELQRDLLEYVDGDRSIKNPSRVMRLAGCWHIRVNSELEIRNSELRVNSEVGDGQLEVEYNQSRIISESGCTYTYSQLRSVIPSSVNSYQQPTEIRGNGHKSPLITDTSASLSTGNCSLITEQEVPLYQFLTKDDRALIDAGAVNGTRNSSGAKLARNLIGTSSRLDYLGIRFTGEPYQLFLAYCARCKDGNGWNEREWEAIWKSAQSNNPTASLTDDALINCALAYGAPSVSAWINKQGNGNNGSSPPSNKGHSSPKVVRHPNFTPLPDQEIAALIDDLINLELPPSKLTAKLNKIAQIAHIPVNEVRKLYSERICELELADSRESTAAELEQLRSATSSSLDLSTVIPEPLAEPIKKLAHWLNLRPECYLIAMLTGTSTLNDTETELVLHRDWDFTVTPNLFVAIVSPSAQKKSPIIKAMVTKPLRRLQRKARQEHKLAMQQYETDLARYELLKRNKETAALEKEFPNGRPVEPRMKLYYFTNATGEGMLNQVAAHPDQGILYLKDELAGVFKSTNQYRNGRGSDEEDILSYYDGTGGTVLRANGTQADLDGLLLGILGSIQPGVLQKLLGDFEDSNGNWARFMFVWQPLAASSMVPDGGKFDLTELIAWLYEELDKTSALAPKQYFLTPDAFKLFCEAYNSLEQRRIDPATTPAMQNVWGKSEGRVGKLAINLHRVEAVFKGQLPSELIERHTIKAAITLSYFSAQQVQAIYSMLGSENSLPPMLAKVLDIAERKGDWVTARDVQFGFTLKKRPKAETVRQWFAELEALNLGTTQGQGRRVKFQLTPHPPEELCGHCGQNVDGLTTEEMQTGTKLQPFVVNVVNSEPFSEKGEGNSKSQNPTTMTTNSPNAVAERITPVDKLTTNRPQRPQTDPKNQNGSPVKIHEAGNKRDVNQNLTPNSSTDPPIIDWNELLEAMDKEMKRLSWGVDDGRAYLQHKYHKKSRQALTDEEALEFYQFLANRKTGYLVGERVVVSHADPDLNGQLAKVISVKPNNILEIEFADYHLKICEVSALHVTLTEGGGL